MQLAMTAHECVENCGGEEVVEEELSDEVTLWSNPKSWPSGAVPVDGEDVLIESGVNMVLDVDTARLSGLEINGRLTFLDNATEPLSLTLNAERLHVRAGELFIGNETHPYMGNATIMLNGAANAGSLFIGIGINAGNKIFAVTGTAKLFGLSRDNMSRLRATVFKGDKSATVFTGLDW